MSRETLNFLIAAQQRFSAIQDRVNAARRLHTQTAAELSTLLPAILDKAFRGELRTHQATTKNP